MLSKFSLAAALTFFLYIVLLVLVKLDTEFVYRWPLLFLYFVLLLILPLFLISSKWPKLKNSFATCKLFLASQKGKQELWIFLLIVSLAVATRFLFLKEHPFLTWGDELWDAGIDTLRVLSGEIKNFYIIGFPDTYRMPSMGYIQTLIPIPFAFLFAHTPYMYRIPAALLGITDILLVYFICRKYINRTVAIFAALTLISLPIHIFFSRTEVVIITNAVVATFFCFFIFSTYQRYIENSRWIALMGLWIGFTATFQTSTRIIALIYLGILIILLMINELRKQRSHFKLKVTLIKLLLLFTFTFVGFGPKILFIIPQTFIHSEKSVLFQDIDQSELKKLTPEALSQLTTNVVNVLIKRYPTSFLGYVSNPLTNLVEFHYTEEKPLLPPLLALLFLAGLVIVWRQKSSLGKWFAVFALMVPLTHSALTPELNWSYRMFVGASAAAVLIGVGMWQIVSRISLKLVRYTLISIFCLYLFNLTVRFYILEPHMANRPVEEYMTTHLSYFLQSHLNPNQDYNFCMKVNPQQLKFMNWVHAQNQYKYFVPNATIEVSADPAVTINTLYLNENCQPKNAYEKFVVRCSQNLYSVCPQPTMFRQQHEPNEINKDFIFYY